MPLPLKALLACVLVCGCHLDGAEEPETLVRCAAGPLPSEVDLVLQSDHPDLSAARAEMTALVDIEFPVGLEFPSSDTAAGREMTEASKKRFVEFLRRLTEQGTASTNAFKSARDGTRSTEARALACHGLVASAAWVAYQLEAAPIPEVARTGPYANELEAAYCEVLRERARPIREQAERGRAQCAQRD